MTILPMLWGLTVGLAIAFGILVFFLLRKQRPFERMLGMMGAVLVGAVSPWATIVALFLSALFEPWPLSLRQGPDTETARENYAAVLGLAPPADVTQLYCRREWGFGGDGIDSIRFAFHDRATVADLVERLRLAPVADAARSGVRYLAAPAWWPSAARLSSLREVYRGGGDVLWVDTAAGVAYFQRANF